MPTETDKRTALVDLIESTLGAVERGVTVVDRFRVARTGQKAERDEVMGDPPYYVELQREGYDAGQSTARSTGRAPYKPAHVYGVMLWYDYEDTERRKADWDALIEGEQGLLPTLRQQEQVTRNGETYELRQPQNVREFVTPLSNRGPDGELAHYCEFSITAVHTIDH
jgi:hypothetical protein